MTYLATIDRHMTTEIEADTAMQAFALVCERVLPDATGRTVRAHVYGDDLNGVVRIPAHQFEAKIRIRLAPAEAFVPRPIRRKVA